MNKEIKLIEDLGIIDNGKYRFRFGIYKCPVCNEHFKARTNNVNTGNTRMCRPCSIDLNRKHGDATFGNKLNRLYLIWCDIKSRCLTKSNKSYGNYGGRGIKVCDEWLDYISFKDWAMKSGYSSDLTIDRIDVDKGYFPDNCKWSNYNEQAANKRKKANSTSIYIGVSFDKTRDKWVAQSCYAGKRKNIGRFDTEKCAAIARDRYIIQNNLPHKLNFPGG